MRATPRTEAGFSLIELMIVVSIIGLIAALAIPRFLTMQLRARRSEALVMLHSLSQAQQRYHNFYDGYRETAQVPHGRPGRQARPVDNFSGRGNYQALEWIPDGQVYCVYECDVVDPDLAFCRAECDLDGDGQSFFMYHEISPDRGIQVREDLTTWALY